MPVVHTEVEVPGVPLTRVWDAVADFERYPETMRDVLEVRVLSRTERRARSDWRVLLNGSELTWTEDDVFEPEHRIVFDQVEGDLEVFRGEWVLEQRAGLVVVKLAVEFDLGIPSLAPLLDPIGVRAIMVNSRNMLDAIGVTSAGSGERGS
jgi:ribosome-associated toxin RatA of RatAB toxin-antitoxin module